MIFKYITRSLFLLVLFSLITITGCEDEKVAPEMSAYFKADMPDANKLEAPADVVFINASKNGLTYHWDFSDAYLKNDPDRTHTYTGISPDTVHFPVPGTYNVTVTVVGSDGQEDATYTETYEFAKKVPVISYTPESILNDTAVSFTVDFLRFEDKTPTFEWTFEDGEPGTSTEENPVVQFQAAGIKHVTLALNDGEETLNVSTTVEVQSTLSPTLYFTDMGSQQIYMMKMSGLEDEEVIPTGAVLADGSIPMSMAVNNGRVYYSNTDNTLGSGTFGEIKSFKWDGTDHKTIITGGTGHTVPFSMVIHGNDLYFTERFSGIYKVNKTTENQDIQALNLWLHHSSTEFYSNGITYGNQNGGVAFYEDKIWWSKCSNGKGMYVFDTSLPTNEAGKITGEKYIENYPMRSFTIDDNTGKIYFFLNKDVGELKTGMHVVNADGTGLVTIEEYAMGSDFDGTGSSAQYIGVTGITILDDYVYWGYRDNGNAVETSGIKRARLDGTEVEMFLPGYIPYGIVIDKTPR